MRTIVIFNEKAGTAANAREPVTAERLHALFSAAGVAADVRATPPARLAEALKGAIAERPPAIFVGGGDGSISTAAGLLAGTGIPLGVLPLGTLNHFAKDLGLPTGYEEAVTVLARGTPQTVDVAEVNGRVFINNCSIGAYADAVRHRETLRRTHGHGKWPAMLRACFTVFRRLRRIRAQLDVGDATHAIRTPFIFIANNRYSGSILQQSLRERLDEGQVWIYTTRAHRHLTLLRIVWQTLRRSLDAADAMDALAIAQATIRFSEPSLAIAVDGEIVQLQTPLHVRVRPRALTVILPPRPSP